MSSSQAERGIEHEVLASDSIRLDDGARDRSVPAVVVPRTEDGLIDGSANKVAVNHSFKVILLSSQHIVERVFIVFEPKMTLGLNICGRIFSQLF